MSTTTAGRAPSRPEIAPLFRNLETGDYQAFFANVSPQVDWTVMGTHPLAGRYTSLENFQQATLSRLGKVMKPPGLRAQVRNVIGGGEGAEWATVELIVRAECKDGLKFDNTYAWCVRFDEGGMIVEVRAYLDSWLVRRALEGNEEGEVESRRAPVPEF